MALAPFAPKVISLDGHAGGELLTEIGQVEGRNSPRKIQWVWLVVRI